MLALLHGTVGLQHASMALYNAWCDRVPVYMMVGNTRRRCQARARRRMGALGAGRRRDRARLRQVGRPAGLAAAFRRIRGARLQDRDDAADGAGAARARHRDAGRPDPASTRSSSFRSCRRLAPLVGDPARVAECAQLWSMPSNPVIVADRCARTQAGIEHLVELAECCKAPVVDLGGAHEFSEPPPAQPERPRPRRRRAGRRHPRPRAGEFLGRDARLPRQHRALFGDRRSSPARSSSASARPISIIKANYQDFQRYTDIDLVIPGDAEATLPYLIEAVKHRLPADRKAALAARGEKLAAAHRQAIASAQARRALRMGREPDRDEPACPRSSGKRSATRIGRSAASAATTGRNGRSGCGT